MKLLLPCLALFAVSTLCAQENEPPQRTISVSGKSEKVLPADKIAVSVSIRTVRDTLAAAQEASKANFETVAQSLVDLTIPKEKLSLQDHSLGREYDRGPNGKQTPIGFYSERSFKIELDDTSLLEAVYQELAQNADLRVRGTDFSRTDEIEVRKELRKLALIAAKEKATEMAAVYELFIGNALKISESGAFSPAQFNTRNTMAFDAGVGVQGKVTLSASVAVVFELVN